MFTMNSPNIQFHLLQDLLCSRPQGVCFFAKCLIFLHFLLIPRNDQPINPNLPHLQFNNASNSWLKACSDSQTKQMNKPKLNSMKSNHFLNTPLPNSHVNRTNKTPTCWKQHSQYFHKVLKTKISEKTHHSTSACVVNGI